MKPFCNYLTNQLRVEYGQLRPCCWFKNSVPVYKTQLVEEFRTQLSQMKDWDSTNGNCNECYHREQQGLYSPRLDSLSNKRFINSTVGSIDSIEIQIDKDCNAACLICGPWNSTTWEKYENRIQGIPIKEIHDSESDTEAYIKLIKQTLPFDQAKHILFLGGEPLRSDSHIKVLENVKDLSQTNLYYTTNGSYKPSKDAIRLWQKCKKVTITFSIDAVGEHFNYLRWPLQWDRVEENIRFFIDLDCVQLRSFSYTTTPFSMFYYDQYVKWGQDFFKETKYKDKNMFDTPWQPRGSTPMSLSAIPPTLASVITEKYGANHSITKLLETYNPHSYNWFIEYITLHDQHRKTDWRKTFPEMIEYFNQ